MCPTEIHLFFQSSKSIHQSTHSTVKSPKAAFLCGIVEIPVAEQSTIVSIDENVGDADVAMKQVFLTGIRMSCNCRSGHSQEVL
jgi:hypothetical protein